ncbi:alpha-ketoglutarate-dependent dioxygenase AlkB family protein [Parashewanella tropica]|uniref:alpha-ketoglutarate-dependent dioxygenase AlkB family protein n=1 Tax=Parashewanella tropica TaxID=2547970 RepID=UPI001FECA0CA|nr:alpha-ketoglutarate-dependent dioxygenase AlkB [Parashewanella tropica]
MQQSLALEGSELPVKIVRRYLTNKQRQLLLAEAERYPFSSPQIEVFGKVHTIPRSQVWLADDGCDYLYSKKLITAQPWFHYVARLKEQLNTQFSQNFNGVLINHYANGHEHMGWHSDDEPEIVVGSDIASVSIGASRDFVLKHKTTHQKYTISLECGDLLIMPASTQSDWLHALPKRLKVTEPRINFTFRQIISDYH